MKNLMFLFTFLLGLTFASDISAQHSALRETVFVAPVVNSATQFKSKAQIDLNLKTAIPYLIEEANGLNEGTITKKHKTIEVMLYKTFYSDLSTSDLVKLYNDVMTVFNANFSTPDGQSQSEKQRVIEDFNFLILK